MAERDWNDNYAQGFLPWDVENADEHLVEFVRSNGIAPCRALDVGCGTGTHSLWLAEQGFEVVGIDVAPIAIERAQAKAKAVAHGSRCRFATVDFLHGDAPKGPFGLVFDRGCFHVFDEHDDRALFAERVAACLAPDGRWLSLIGSTEGPPRDHGPPRRTVRDIANAIEPALELTLLRTMEFDVDLPTRALAWYCVSKPRSVPAQPSTIHPT